MSPTIFASEKQAENTNAPIAVDGSVKNFEVYNIDGNNYFKLRDIAFILSGSSKQFDISWDSENDAINLISGKEYTPVGNEMTRQFNIAPRTAVSTTSAVYLDGKALNLSAYNIDNSNYFKLRDLGEALDFSVEWNSGKNYIYIETMFGYVSEDTDNNYFFARGTGVKDTNVTNISNWANVSPFSSLNTRMRGLLMHIQTAICLKL
ncbi:MAG: hypothetical protein ACI4EA_09220 [Candidatus Ornithomonoglobus sp.]